MAWADGLWVAIENTEKKAEKWIARDGSSPSEPVLLSSSVFSVAQKAPNLAPTRHRAYAKRTMNEFELTYRLPDGVVTRIVTARDPEAAELLAPLEASDIAVRSLRRKGPACQRTNPTHWPQRR